MKEEENKAAARAELERKKKEAEDLQRKVDEARRSGTPRWQDAPEEPAPTFAGDEHGEMVQIPAGNFQMGSNSGGNDEKPVHEVFLDEYYLDKYEVTVSQFRDFKTDYEPSDRSSCDGCPATNVSWYDAKSYCESVGKRLPTEAEWEKACGGPEGYSWSWGNRAESSKGRFGLSWDDGAVRVGSYGANGYGLHDMSGNAWEWCQDGYENDYYSKSPRNNPINETGSSGRVLRGGSWVSGANNARCENRNNLKPDLRHDSDGFRCAR